MKKSLHNPILYKKSSRKLLKSFDIEEEKNENDQSELLAKSGNRYE